MRSEFLEFVLTLAKTTFTLDDWFNMRGILNRRWLLLMSVVVGRIWSGKKITFESSNICNVLKFVCDLWLRYFFRENLKKIWIHENNWQMNLFFTTDSSKALSLLLEGETWAWSFLVAKKLNTIPTYYLFSINLVLEITSP